MNSGKDVSVSLREMVHLMWEKLSECVQVECLILIGQKLLGKRSSDKIISGLLKMDLTDIFLIFGMTKFSVTRLIIIIIITLVVSRRNSTGLYIVSNGLRFQKEKWYIHLFFSIMFHFNTSVFFSLNVWGMVNMEMSWYIHVYIYINRLLHLTCAVVRMQTHVDTGQQVSWKRGRHIFLLGSKGHQGAHAFLMDEGSCRSLWLLLYLRYLYLHWHADCTALLHYAL